MSKEPDSANKTLVLHSARFGDLTVPADSIIEIPSGLIGFPRFTKFVMIEHKPPFSWLHSAEDPNLAFVVVDGFQFGEKYTVRPPVGDKDIELKENDEYAILVLVTVRPDPYMTTANLKAPVFVNIRNRRGVQVIFDDPHYSTRFPLWSSEEKPSECSSPEPLSGSSSSDESKE